MEKDIFHTYVIPMAKKLANTNIIELDEDFENNPNLYFLFETKSGKRYYTTDKSILPDFVEELKNKKILLNKLLTKLNNPDFITYAPEMIVKKTENDYHNLLNQIHYLTKTINDYEIF